MRSRVDRRSETTTVTCRERGFTLLEVLIYTGIMAVVMAPIVSVLLVSTRTNQAHGAMNSVMEKNRVTLHRISEELRIAIRSTITVGDDGKSITFNLPSGFNGESIVVGPRIRLLFEPASNGGASGENGLGDTGQLSRVNLDTKEKYVITLGINLSESRFELVGNAIRLNLSNGAIIQPSNSMYSVFRSIQIKPRNR